MPLYPFRAIGSPKRKLLFAIAAATLGVTLLLWYSLGRGVRTTHRTYTTKFPLREDPISEGGNWTNGQVAGLDWANVRTTPGFASGTEAGTVNYDDATALLTGRWGPNQSAQATVRTVNQDDRIFEEVELRLRSSLAVHRATGYEVLFRCSKTRNAYTEIVRWNGPLGKFSILNEVHGPQFGVADGDVVRATIAGNVITAFINGTRVLQTTDNTYVDGSPGMGFYLQGSKGVNGDYGFTAFAATDGSLPEFRR